MLDIANKKIANEWQNKYGRLNPFLRIPRNLRLVLIGTPMQIRSMVMGHHWNS